MPKKAVFLFTVLNHSALRHAPDYIPLLIELGGRKWTEDIQSHANSESVAREAEQRWQQAVIDRDARLNRQAVREQFENAFPGQQREVAVAMALMDKHAEKWANEQGKGLTANDWYASRIAGIVREWDEAEGPPATQALDQLNRLYQEDNDGISERKEKVRRRDALLAMEPVEVDSTPLGSMSDVAAMRENAKLLYSTFEPVTNIHDNKIIEFKKSGLKKTLSHSGDGTNIKIIQGLREIVKNAIPLESERSRYPDSKNDWYHFYGVRATIDGEDVFVRVVVREEPRKGNAYYDSIVTTKVKIDKALEGRVSSLPMDEVTQQSLIKDRLLQWLDKVNRENELFQADQGVLNIAREYGVPTATKDGKPNNRQIVNIVRKYGGEEAANVKRIEDITPEMARRAFETRTPASFPTSPLKAGGETEQPFDRLRVNKEKAKGSVRFGADGRALIRAYEAADVTTMMHEVGHIFVRDLTGADLEAVAKYTGLRDGAEVPFIDGTARVLGLAPDNPDVKVYEVDGEMRRTGELFQMVDTVDGEIKEVAVLLPEQVKSVHNEGTFDTNNPNSLFQTDKFDLGPKLTEFYHNAKDAIKKLREMKTGDAKTGGELLQEA